MKIMVVSVEQSDNIYEEGLFSMVEEDEIELYYFDAPNLKTAAIKFVQDSLPSSIKEISIEEDNAETLALFVYLNNKFETRYIVKATKVSEPEVVVEDLSSKDIEKFFKEEEKK